MPLTVIIVISLSDFLSKNLPLLVSYKRIFPGKVVPYEIMTYWSSIVMQNIIIGMFCISILTVILTIFIQNTKKNFTSIPRIELILPFLAFSIGVYLWQLPEGNVDYTRYYIAAKNISKMGIIEYFRTWTPSGSDLPIIPAIYGLIFRFFGVLRVNIQIFKTILFALTIYLTYLIGKDLWNKTVGIYSGLILISAVPYLMQVPLMLVDIPFVFFIVLLTYLIISTYRNRFWFIIGISSSILILLTMMSKGSAIIIVPLIFIAVTVVEFVRIRNFKIIIVRGLTILIPLILLLIVSMIIFEDKFLLLYETAVTHQWIQMGFTTSFINAAINLLSVSWTIRDPLGNFRNAVFLLGSIVITMSIIGILYLLKKRDARVIILVLCVIVPLFFLPNRNRFDLVRYLFPVIPFFAISCASLFSILKRNTRLILLGSLLVSSALTASLIAIPLRNATGMAAIQSSCNIANSLDVDSVGIVHIAETPWGKFLQAHKGQLIIHFEYNMIHEIKYYHTEELIRVSDDYPNLLILVSDNYNLPDGLHNFLLRYNHISTSEGYLGGSWSPIICRTYTLKAESN